MPKQKTHSGAKKRFKVTGSGKLMKQQAEPSPQPRGQVQPPHPPPDQDQVLAPGDAKVAKKLLGL